MQKKLTQMLHMEREPVGIYFGNTTAACDRDANPEVRNCVIPFLMKVSDGQVISMDEKSCLTTHSWRSIESAYKKMLCRAVDYIKLQCVIIKTHISKGVIDYLCTSTQ